MIVGLERTWGYLMRHFPIDPNRVCVAGEGTGATVAAATSFLTDRMTMRAVACEPRRFAKLNEFPLPLPELRGDDPLPENALHVLVAEGNADWWEGELEEYRTVGLDVRQSSTTEDPWSVFIEREDAIRRALGVEPLADGTESSQRRYLVVKTDSPRARHWARLTARRIEADGSGPVAVVEETPASGTPVGQEIRAEDFAGEGALPRCPGPFGGTTVIVLPDGLAQAEVDAWHGVAADDPIAKKSRFHRLRLATPDGERALPNVLDELRSAGRFNVLIIPATFCADAALMQSLERSVRHLSDEMTLQWLPGLGGR